MRKCPAAFTPPAETLASTYQIEVAGRLVGAEASLKPLYDPSGLRIAG